VGKKKLKAINRALRNVTGTPRLRRRGTGNFTPSPFDAAPQYSFLNRDKNIRQDIGKRNGSGNLRALAISNSQASLASKANGSRTSLPQPAEEQPLNAGQDSRFPGLTRYGSIIGSPPSHEGGAYSESGRPPPSLRLPGAALDAENASLPGGSVANTPATVPKSKSVQLPQETDNAFEVGKTRSPHHKASTTLPFRHRSIFSPKRVNSTPGVPTAETVRPSVRRLFSLSHKAGTPSPHDVPLEAYRDLDIRQAEFFNFLDMELEKIEAFYKQKEDEATDRLSVLREQLHIMRDRRLDELISHQAAKIKAKEKKKSAASQGLLNGNGQVSSSDEDFDKVNSKGGALNTSWLNPIDSALEAVRHGRYGKTTKAMTDLATPSGLNAQDHPDDRRDYIRRPEQPGVPYQTAKRKLKGALQEYYRGLELLKSYALLNRTAFRKINKKYDKTVNARPSMRYMTEKVNKAWFVQSDVIEGHIRAVEDLYARYFERGNHKVAVGKLRIKAARAGDFTENSFRNGLTLSAGLVFGIQGLVYGIELLNSPDQILATNTSYLFQVGMFSNGVQKY
jgi:xenotropic and polytropic retrovirus receptor 1